MMDHKLAIVIVPHDTKDPVQASSALLERFQKVSSSDNEADSSPKFRYKRVGGWFDGLVAGQIGKERWSTVLTMLLSGVPTNAPSPFPGFGPETELEIEGRIERDNTLDLDDVWPLAPCTIIVTPEGEWAAHPDPDQLDKVEGSQPANEANEAWKGVKRALFRKYRGWTAVAWDLSWNFIKPPSEEPALSGSRVPLSGSARRPRATSQEAWTMRITSAQRRVAAQQTESRERDLVEDAAALDAKSAQPS